LRPPWLSPPPRSWRHGRLRGPHPEDALARANVEIREPTPYTDERRLAQRALNLADELLGEIEELQLRGHTDVPSGCGHRATELGWAAIIAGVRDPRLETYAGVFKLTDDVYTLEDRLMRRLRTRMGRRGIP